MPEGERCPDCNDILSRPGDIKEKCSHCLFKQLAHSETEFTVQLVGTPGPQKKGEEMTVLKVIRDDGAAVSVRITQANAAQLNALGVLLLAR